MYYIYEIYNSVTQRKYIGLTYDPKSRFRQHLIQLKNGTHTAENIVADYVRHGQDSFSFRLIDTAKTREEGLNKEKRYILRLKTYVPEYGYNGNDNRFYHSKPIIKCKDSELTRKIKAQGYLLHNLYWKFGGSYNSFINKLNNPENFTEDELNKLIEYISVKAVERYMREVKEWSHGKK